MSSVCSFCHSDAGRGSDAIAPVQDRGPFALILPQGDEWQGWKCYKYKLNLILRHAHILRRKPLQNEELDGDELSGNVT